MRADGSIFQKVADVLRNQGTEKLSPEVEAIREKRKKPSFLLRFAWSLYI